MTSTQFDTSTVESIASDFATFGAVHLDVTDGERSLGFWRDLVGLELLGRDGPNLRLGVGGRELVVLHPGATGPVDAGGQRPVPHVVPPAEPGGVRPRLRPHRGGGLLPVPDGPRYAPRQLRGRSRRNRARTRLRVAAERPRGVGRAAGVRADRQRRSPLGRARSALPRLAPVARPRRRYPAGATGRHDRGAHAPAGRRRRRVTGVLPRRDRLHRQQVRPRAGMFDMSAGGTFSHRLAGNTWESAGLPQRPAEAAGMRQFTLQLRSEGDFAATLARVEASGHEIERQRGGALVADPSGTRLLLAAPAAR